VHRPRLPRLGARPLVAPEVVESAEYAFGRSDLSPLAASLRSRLRDRGRSIGSPDQLRRAIEEACGPLGDGGSVEVHRIPAAIHMGESWHVRLESVRPDARRRVEALLAEARGVR
jgi:hypothetical protein